MSASPDPTGPLALRPVATRRAFEDILEQLETAIASGALAAGDRLPPERELATRFHVSRTSVREALRVLEALGVVEIRRGADNGAVLAREPDNAFATILRLLLGLRHVGLRDLVQFRAVIEAGAARELADGRHPEERAVLRGIVEQMEADGIDQQAFHRLDAALHITLVHSVCNPLIDLVADAVDSALRKVITDVSLVAGDWEQTRRRLIAEHRAILAAIDAADAERAVASITRHVRYWGGEVARASDAERLLAPSEG